MVSICAGCDNFAPWAASIVSGISGVIYLILSHLLIKVKLDDPLDAFAVHAGAGKSHVSVHRNDEWGERLSN